MPGVTLYAPVAASWVKVAAGTVMRGEHAGGGIIGVLRRGGQRRAVEGHGQTAEPGIEGVGDNSAGCGVRRRVAGVLQGEGVGQLPVLRHGGGGEGLADGQPRRGGG